MTYEDGIAWGNAWVVPKGASNAKLAMEAINYALSPEAQARLLELGTYGPVLGDAAAKGTPEQRKVLVTAPENIKNMRQRAAGRALFGEIHQRLGPHAARVIDASLRPSCAMERRACVAVTEPQAGSDPRMIGTGATDASSPMARNGS